MSPCAKRASASAACGAIDIGRRHGVTEFLSVFQDVGSTFYDLETDLLIVLDTSGGIDRVNMAFERVLGYHEASIRGHALIEFVSVDDMAKFIRSFSEEFPQPFKMLHSWTGVVMMRLVKCRFRAGRGYVILREVKA